MLLWFGYLPICLVCVIFTPLKLLCRCHLVENVLLVLAHLHCSHVRYRNLIEWEQWRVKFIVCESIKEALPLIPLSFR